MTEKLQLFLIVLFVLLALGIAGRGDVDAMTGGDLTYCPYDNVWSNEWHDCHVK